MAEAQRDEIAKLEALFAANPEGRVFTHLAEAYRKAGELEHARDILSEGLRRHPDVASAYVVLGKVEHDRADDEAARRAFAQALSLDRGNLIALRFLGELAVERGDRAEALTHYRELLHRDLTDNALQQTVDQLSRSLEEETAVVAGPEAPAAGDVVGVADGLEPESYAGEEPPLGGPAAEVLEPSPPAETWYDAGQYPGLVSEAGQDILPAGAEEPEFLLISPEPELPAAVEFLIGETAEPTAEEIEYLSLDLEPDVAAEDGLEFLSLDDAAFDVEAAGFEPDAAGFGLGAETEPGAEAVAPPPGAADGAGGEYDVTEDADSHFGYGQEDSVLAALAGAPDEPEALAFDREWPGDYPSIAEAEAFPADPARLAFEEAAPPADLAPPGELAGTPFSEQFEEPAAEEPGEELYEGAPAEEPFSEAPAAEPAEGPAAGMDDFVLAAAFEAPAEPLPSLEDLTTIGDLQQAEGALPGPPVTVGGGPGAEAPELYTETMAELYRSQGFAERAAEVYRWLLARDPGNERLAVLLGELEAERADAAERQDAGSGARGWPADLHGVESAFTGGAGAAAGADTPYAWAMPGEEPSPAGPRIGEYLRTLLAWRPVAAEVAALVVPEPVPELVLDDVIEEQPEAGGAGSAGVADVVRDPTSFPGWEPDVTSESAGAPEASGTPTAAADLMPWEFAEPPALSAPEGPAADMPAAAAESSAGQEPPAAAGEPDAEDEDLEVFRSWLQSLKK